ncbi:hypothetical protein IFM89_019100 [Coptis chinensis]|uniref:t-SNARE coiled-coil homology domain-containing protein n=1 Tax=Coptis chinensis TaxID=261450 RepID=A0A835HNN0_9MAGN|nr:hypothetical protein IFM89_019100 [Coptis chinensis]
MANELKWEDYGLCFPSHLLNALRNRIVTKHKEGLKRRYYNATGKVATDEEIDKLASMNGQVKEFASHTELDLENLERQEAIKEIQRSLTELHQVFLDMAVLVDAQVPAVAGGCICTVKQPTPTSSTPSISIGLLCATTTFL